MGLVLLADFLFVERLKNCFRFSFKKEKGGKKIKKKGKKQGKENYKRNPGTKTVPGVISQICSPVMNPPLLSSLTSYGFSFSKRKAPFFSPWHPPPAASSPIKLCHLTPSTMLCWELDVLGCWCRAAGLPGWDELQDIWQDSFAVRGSNRGMIKYSQWLSFPAGSPGCIKSIDIQEV